MTGLAVLLCLLCVYSASATAQPEPQPNGDFRHVHYARPWFSQVTWYHGEDPDVVPGAKAPGATIQRFRNQFPIKSSLYDKKMRIDGSARRNPVGGFGPQSWGQASLPVLIKPIQTDRKSEPGCNSSTVRRSGTIHQDGIFGDDTKNRVQKHFVVAQEKKRYRWLFRQRRVRKRPSPEIKTTRLQQLDRDIKEARKLYLSGETDNAILKYRSAIDRFESIVNDIPPGDPLLDKIQDRFSIYDELATKILGPLHLEPKEDYTAQVFHLMEKRRICRRNIALKKAGTLRFADVPDHLLQEESDLLRRLQKVRSGNPETYDRSLESKLKSKLTQLRKALRKSSKRFAMLRRGVPPSLDQVRNDLLRDDEMILDFSLLQDRVIIGVITKEKAAYHQISVKRKDIDAAVANLQDKLREFTYGDRSTFMGHAWKEPCRRIYRALLGNLPPLPRDKPSVLVIPDGSLWYLPMSVMLDPEDRPFGADRLISLIPSADMLRFIRTSGPAYNRTVYGNDLLVLESIPWVAEEEVQEGDKKSNAVNKLSEGEKIEQLIMTNPVFPRPSQVVVKVQKIFKKFAAWVGPTATVDRLIDYTQRSAQISLLAVPLAIIDSIRPDRQPCFFFSPDKRGRRRFEVRRLFAHPLRCGLVVLPIAWFDMANRETPLGEGPILMTTAMFYSGINVGMINYSDPNWGSEAPFLLSVLKRIAEKKSLKTALSDFKRELPAGLDSSFQGKPPSWTGWILFGDPGR